MAYNYYYPQFNINQNVGSKYHYKKNDTSCTVIPYTVNNIHLIFHADVNARTESTHSDIFFTSSS